MKQIFMEDCNTLQVVSGCVEKHSEDVTGLSQSVEKWAHSVLSVFSDKIWDIGWLDGFNILCAVFLIIVAISCCKPKFKISLFHHLKIQVFVVWILGVIIYMLGFNEKGSAESVVALMLRSCLSSMEMFVSHSDLIEVREELHENAMYMAFFSLVHFYAVAISAIFILRLFGFRVISWIRIMWLYLKSLIPFGHCSCYYHVLFGVNANTMAYAKSIAGKQPHRVIFINMPGKGHGHASTRFSFSHFFHSDSNGVDKYIEDIEKMDALLLNSSCSFENADLSFDESSVFKVFRALNFSSIVRVPLQKLLRRTAMKRIPGEVNYFFLSEDEKDNIMAVTVLQRLQKERLSDDCAFNCYCHARKNRNNSAMLNDGTLVFKVHIIDTSNLAVTELKKNCEYHPVNFVDKGAIPGTTSSAFNAMVIGFGEAGRDAFRFLYEFGSFTKDDEGNPSEKNIHVVDKDIEKLKAAFLNETPALRDKPEVKWWKAESVCSEDFWENLKDVIQNLNYIVITVGNDDEAMDIATSLFEFAYRYRDNLAKFRIFVRLRDSVQEGFLRTHSEFFNVIIPFGSNMKAFSYDVINNDVLEKNAKRFFYKYGILRGDFKRHDGMSEDDAASIEWEKRRKNYVNEEDRAKRKEKEIDIWYKEEQDRSNAWHIYTKVALANVDITLESLLLGSGKRLLRNLSDCEHLRWNAKMELLGFEPATDKDFQKAKDDKKGGGDVKHPWKSIRLRKHECMVDCLTLHSNKIFSETIPYDESVVMLSFKMTEEEKRQFK